MKISSVILFVAGLIAALFFTINRESLMAPLPVDLLLWKVDVPFGLTVLLVMGGLWILGILWALLHQASFLLEVRRAYKEAAGSKNLADHAEISRFAEARKTIEAALAGQEKMVEQQTQQMSEQAAKMEEMTAVFKSMHETLAAMNSSVNAKLEEVESRIDAKIAERVTAALTKAETALEPEKVPEEPVKEEKGFFASIFGSKNEEKPAGEKTAEKAPADSPESPASKA